MKKLFFTSITALAISMPAMADPNIAVGTNPASCTEPVLGTTSGESNLQAKWTANTLNIDWYNGDEKITSTTCTYDGGITIPSEDPEKTGYTFNGWTIRRASAASAQQCSLSDVDTSINGTAYGYSSLNGEAGSKETEYGLTVGSGEWATEFEYGIVKGIARCSTVGSGYTRGQTGNPTDDLDLNDTENGAQYCWCQATDYVKDRAWVEDSSGDNNASDVYITGFSNKMNCIKAVRSINGMGLAAAKSLVESASAENPQLVEGATSADISTLTDGGCTTVGASGHYEETQCSVAASLWAFNAAYGSAAYCASACTNSCGNSVRGYEALRAGVFGSVAQ